MPLRTPADFAGERGGFAPWCGPTVVAQAAGVTYAEACGLLRRVEPSTYPDENEIVTAYWSDLLTSLGLARVAVRDRPVAGRPTLSALVREGLEPGWWLVRVTGHFLLLEVDGDQGARVFDNRHHGTPLSAQAHGRCRVTHLARLPRGLRPPAR
ncbi:MAG TPA: hypothetical protein VD970_14460 [Acetobacteraceae bacterium]|nr:hypothetical protein [Acetobacteraceae bacterium]